MKKMTLALSLLLATSTIDCAYASEIPLGSSSDSVEFANIADNARFASIKEYRTNFPLQHGLVTEPCGIRVLKIVDQVTFDRLISGHTKEARLKEKLSKYGYAKVESIFYVVRDADKATDVPVVSPFFAKVRGNLPLGTYALIESTVSQNDLLAWASAGYDNQFSKGKPTPQKPQPSLFIDGDLAANLEETIALAEVTKTFRDLLRTATNEFTPEVGAALMDDLAKKYSAKTKTYRGEALKEKFGMTHEVGKGAGDKPNVTILEWSPVMVDPVMTLDLVGKGICMDTGGYNIKTSMMELMNGDKGGALSHMALAELIMQFNLPIKLRFGAAWAINAIGPDATYPSDIYHVGDKTVSNGNTDAEGRLVMASILDHFAQNNPAEMTITQATLTGAQLVGLGTWIGAYYVSDGELAASLNAGMKSAGDPMWRMPRVPESLAKLKTSKADLNSMGGPYGGSMTADAFLTQFAAPTTKYVHLDTASETKGTPGFTPGVTDFDLFGSRGLFEMLKNISEQRKVSTSS